MLVGFLVYSLAVYITSYVLPGIVIKDFFTSVVVALVLGLVNTFIRPVFLFFTFPITILTFGLFVFVVNALMVLLVDALIPDFEAKSFWWALAFSVVLSIVSSLIFSVTKVK
ncbi:MAG: phage holin family protein [Candidatus Shapirobacteria bacterium]